MTHPGHRHDTPTPVPDAPNAALWGVHLHAEADGGFRADNQAGNRTQMSANEPDASMAQVYGKALAVYYRRGDYKASLREIEKATDKAPVERRDLVLGLVGLRLRRGDLDPPAEGGVEALPHRVG